MRDVVSKEYAHYIRSKIIDNKTYSDPKYYGTEEVANSDHGTVHTTVIDQYGNAVSIGSTINL
jgi:gamma-glutamyltranspeptidase/glutathione hydrolase/leukotriene-C4 hydrolase